MLLICLPLVNCWQQQISKHLLSDVPWEKLYPHCLILVGSWDGFKHAFTIKPKYIEGLMVYYHWTKLTLEELSSKPKPNPHISPSQVIIFSTVNNSLCGHKDHHSVTILLQ